MAEKTTIPEIPNTHPEAHYVEVVCIECRLCDDVSPWRNSDFEWDVRHYQDEHPTLPKRDWSTYRWAVTRQMPRYF